MPDQNKDKPVEVVKKPINTMDVSEAFKVGSMETHPIAKVVRQK